MLVLLRRIRTCLGGRKSDCCIFSGKAAVDEAAAGEAEVDASDPNEVGRVLG